MTKLSDQIAEGIETAVGNILSDIIKAFLIGLGIVVAFILFMSFVLPLFQSNESLPVSEVSPNRCEFEAVYCNIIIGNVSFEENYFCGYAEAESYFNIFKENHQDRDIKMMCQ